MRLEERKEGDKIIGEVGDIGTEDENVISHFRWKKINISW